MYVICTRVFAASSTVTVRGWESGDGKVKVTMYRHSVGGGTLSQRSAAHYSQIYHPTHEVGPRGLSNRARPALAKRQARGWERYIWAPCNYPGDQPPALSRATCIHVQIADLACKLQLTFLSMKRNQDIAYRFRFGRKPSPQPPLVTQAALGLHYYAANESLTSHIATKRHFAHALYLCTHTVDD